MIEYPFIIVGAENCDRCDTLHSLLPQAEMVKIPHRPLGLGDSIAWFLDSFRIPSCRGCKVRRSILNKWFPYRSVASKEIRDIRNTVLRLGHEELPVLLHKSGVYIFEIDEFAPKYREKINTSE